MSTHRSSLSTVDTPFLFLFFIHVVNLNAPFHALVMTQDGEKMETNMDDIEISIVVKLWIRNKKLLEEAYA